MTNMLGKFLKKLPSIKKQTQAPVQEETKPFNPRTRKDGDKMTDEQKLKAGFNGSTYSINGRDVDF